MAKTALITGITGFVGSHMAEYLLEQGLKVYGTLRWRSRTDNIEHIKDKIHLIEADIRDGHSCEQAVEEAKPDYIFHLASQSFVPMSWRAPADTMETNVIGTIHLFEATRRLAPEARIHVAGSSEEYGLVYPDELPIRETNPLRPLSPYGVSKVAQDKLSFQYHHSYGLKTVITRAFNHTGPRRGDVFAESNFAKQIADIERDKEAVIYVGNLSAQRDFTDVRDIVRAYWLALEKCKFGESYNICSGKTRKIQEVLQLLLSMSKKKMEIRQDSTRMRPSDVQILQGDSSKFRKETGWEPQIPFEQTLEDLLNYWRNKLAR
ncbi:MAG: GDP-mannose 4,6-dehydratase [Chloroflexota bacterium]